MSDCSIEERITSLQAQIDSQQSEIGWLTAIVTVLILRLNAMPIVETNPDGNLVVSSGVPNLTGTTTAFAVVKFAAASAAGALWEKPDGSSLKISKLKGIFAAAYGASAACEVIPEGGIATLTGLSGAGGVAFASGDNLYAAPNGLLGTLATLRDPMNGWVGMGFTTKSLGVVSTSLAGALILTIQLGEVGIPLA